MRLCRTIASTLLVAVCAAGCAEKAQTVTPAKKADAKAWAGAEGGGMASGWKAGDQDSWEAQMRLRVQGQNEYSRSAAIAAAAPASAASAP
jgi:hypothetical protein